MKSAQKVGNTTEMSAKAGHAAGYLNAARMVLFYAALTIEIAVVIVDKSELHNPYESYVFRLTFALTLAAVALSVRTIRGWALFFCAAAFGFFCYRVTGRNEILRVVVFVAACAGRSREKMLKTAFWETFAGCAAIALLSAAGIFGAQAQTQQYRVEDGIVTRYSFGFGHANALHCMFYMLVLLGMIAFAEKLKWQHLLLLFAANIALYLLTDSRTGMGITALTILLGWGMRFWGKRKWPYPAGAALVLLCVIFSVWSAWISYYLWEGAPRSRFWAACVPYVRKVDAIFSSRITDLYWVFPVDRGDITRWSLFSSPDAQAYFDMGWCRLFYWYGILPALAAVGAILLLIAACAKRRDAAALLMIVSMALYTVMEAHLVSVYIGRNYLLLIFGAAIAEAAWLDSGERVGLPSLWEKAEAMRR